MSVLVLDSGALIALERGDRPMWAALKLAALKKQEVLVPSTALAQVWRGQARQAALGRALASCTMAGFDALSREVGALCGRSRTMDICDAHVALVASGRIESIIYTSDPDDLSRLLSHCDAPDLPPAIVRC